MIRWRLILPGLFAAVALGLFAVRQQPPAPDVATRCVVAAALLLLLKLSDWIVRDGATFTREQRLAAFIGILIVAGGWYAAAQEIAEVAFDYKVTVQREALEESCRELSGEILGFLGGRRRDAPPPPRPANWDQDESRWFQFEDATVAMYVERFDARVRVAHDLLSLRNLQDRDLEAFVRAPANGFQIEVVARRLVVLADRMRREDLAAKR